MAHRVFISAAEPSADHHCAKLIEAVKASETPVSFVGLGGSHMQKAGCQIIESMAQRAAMHYNVLGQIGYYFRVLRQIKNYFKTNKVDLVILCDSPSFNFHVAKIAKKAGIKTLFYVAPQLWAWAPWRIRKMRRLCDMLACLLPFEEKYFSSRGIKTKFVGNPLFDGAPPALDQARASHVFNQEAPTIAIMPGSRKAELETLYEPMQQIALKIARKKPGAKFLIVAANDNTKMYLQSKAVRQLRAEISVNTVIESAARADLVLVASGSATLQVAATGTVPVIMYQSNKFLWNLIGRHLVRIPNLSLVNIVAGRRIVPEFMPCFGSIDPIYNECMRLLTCEPAQLQKIHDDLVHITEPMLKHNASQTTAQIVSEMLEN